MIDSFSINSFLVSFFFRVSFSFSLHIFLSPPPFTPSHLGDSLPPPFLIQSLPSSFTVTKQDLLVCLGRPIAQSLHKRKPFIRFEREAAKQESVPRLTSSHYILILTLSPVQPGNASRNGLRQPAACLARCKHGCNFGRFFGGLVTHSHRKASSA